MEWELLYMCNIIGCLIIFLIFLYHFIAPEEDSKPVTVVKAEGKQVPAAEVAA